MRSLSSLASTVAERDMWPSTAAAPPAVAVVGVVTSSGSALTVQMPALLPAQVCTEGLLPPLRTDSGFSVSPKPQHTPQNFPVEHAA